MRGDPTKAIGIRIPLRLIPTLQEDAAARGASLTAHLSGIVVDHVERSGRAYAKTLRHQEDTTQEIAAPPVAPPQQEVYEAQTHHHRRQPSGQVRYERGAKQEHAVCATCGKDLGWR